MSGLARLLAGHVAPGIYHWPSPADGAAVRHAVETAGWCFIELDTWTVESKDAFLDACKEAFGAGFLVEHSFDGLADALNDVQAGDCAGVVVLWDGWAPFARAHRRAFDVALDVFDARVDTERAGPFAVVLRGPGPDTEVPELAPQRGERSL